MQTPVISHYHYRATWSHDESEYIATCDEFPALQYRCGNYKDALEGIYNIVDTLTDNMLRNGEPLPHAWQSLPDE